MNQDFRLLIVEDETNLGKTLKDYLSDLQYQVMLVSSCLEAKNIFKQYKFDVVLLDIGLPDGDGITLARELRRHRKDFVLLFLSALNDPKLRVDGLELGADDYITKPFELKELTLRLKRILSTKNSLDLKPDEIIIGALKIWFKRFELEDANGEAILMNQKECAILQLLYENRPHVVSRDKIIDVVWGENEFPSSRTVDNYIVKLRKWSETDSSNCLNIHTVRGIGYRLQITGE